MSVFPAIFYVLTYKVETPREKLEILSTLPLAERPPIMVCIEELELHIWVL